MTTKLTETLCCEILFQKEFFITDCHLVMMSIGLSPSFSFLKDLLYIVMMNKLLVPDVVSVIGDKYHSMVD